MPNSSLEARARAEDRVTLPSLKEKWGGFSYPANPIEAVIPDIRGCEIRFGFAPAERASLAQQVLGSGPQELGQLFRKGITPQAVNSAFEAISLRTRNGVFAPVIYESEQIQTPYATIGFVSEPLQFSLLRRSTNRDEKLLDRVLQAAQTSISRYAYLSGMRNAFNSRDLGDGAHWNGVKAIFDPVTGRMLNVGQIDAFIQGAAESWHRARYVAMLIVPGQTDLAEKIWRKQALNSQKIEIGNGKNKQSLTLATVQGEPTNVWVMPSNSWLAEQIQSSRKALHEDKNPSHKNLKLGVVMGGGALITMSALLSACDSGYIPPPPPTEVSLPEPLTEKVAKDVLKEWQGEKIEYGQNLTLDVGSSDFEVDPTFAYPSDNNNGFVEDIQYRFASNKVVETRGETSTEKSYQWLVVSDPTGVRSFILKELSPNEDERVGVNNTTVYALAELKDGKAGETGEKLVVQGKATEQEPSLTLETNGEKKVLVEIRPNGDSAKPTPTAPVDIIEELLAAAADEAQAAEPEPTAIQPTPPETEEVVILPTGVENVVHLKEWEIGLDKDNSPVAILTKEGEAHWIPVPLDQLSQLPSWSQPKLVVSEDGTLRYVDANGKPLYALQGEKWIEEKELYYECGVGWFRIGIRKDIDPLGPDGEILPTGVFGTEFGFLGLKYFLATGCLLDKMTPVPEERFGVKNLYGTKLGFWDSDGNIHGIPAIYGGGVANLGAKPTDQSLSLACFNNTCRAMSVEEAVEKLNTLYDSPNSNFQADFQIVLSQGENQQPDWSLRDYIIDNADLYFALKEAIKTGKNFPQLPEDFVVYLWQISMHE